MLGPRWLMKMSLWARNPPPLKKVLFVFGIIGVCLALFAVERLVGWPDWATVNRMNGRVVR
ncbi:hypothetical protein [Pseudoruegeria sp. SHC-113]|uniref:hypothetical protein n=1 Tax=Pseudoruegeria sp. SHC-113 TaxID=2855439 RepID=UPI0021BA9AD4|nr:hypothetical protein [Pseudoruegeria sp. SHC-113]